MSIALTDVLNIVSPGEFKLHLAGRNSEGRHPLDEWVADKQNWIGWNQWRGSKNDWNRPKLISFIEFYPVPDTWLFGGGFEVLSRQPTRYELRPIEEWEKYVGRLLTRFRRYQGMRGRAFRLETYLPSFSVDQMLREPYSGEVFPGFENIEHDFAVLEALFRHDAGGWRAALGSVKGIYLVADRSNGKKYVGSAYGDAGIWSRWAAYLSTGHGWNDELVHVIRTEGIGYARANFRFSVLEVMTRSTPDTVVQAREAHWKRALLTREHGYNAN